jgi:carboxymethylenebutenolidase
LEIWKFGNLEVTEMKALALSVGLTLVATTAFAQTAAKPAADPHAGHAMPQATPAAQPAARNPNLPPTGDLTGEDKNAQATAQLKSSPRHGEWVDIKSSSGAPIKSFVVYPERKDKAPVVIVIQEIFGLTDWIRGVADQLAKEGFIAIAPDFMSGMGPNKGGSAELGEQGSVKEIGKLTDDDKVRILNDVREYALKIPAANGKTATVGFCWGGAASSLFALRQPALNAAVAYYGGMPTDPAAFAGAKAPILGLYAANDNRVNATLDLAKAELAKKSVPYEQHFFEGAGHGFLRQQNGSERAPANGKAAESAWGLTLEFLRKHTR